MKARSNWYLAAAVVAVLAIGGVAVALRGGDDGPAKLPVLATGSNDATASAASARDEGVAAGGTADALFPSLGSIVYQAGDTLPALGGTAGAYRLAASVDRDRVDALAQALGIDGGVTEDEGGWHVVDGDRRLDVYRSPGVPWSYYSTGGVISGTGTVSSSGTVSPDTPVSDDPAAPGAVPPDGKACDPSMCDAGVVPEPAPVPPPERPADLPGENEARQAALDLLQATGVDVSGAATETYDQITSWGVQIDPVLDGTPTVGFGGYVSVGSGGRIESANGFLARPEAADDYPLIDTGVAIDRLNAGTAIPGPRPLGDVAGEPMPLPAVDAGGGSGASEPGASGSASSGSGSAEPGVVGGCDPAVTPCESQPAEPDDPTIVPSQPAPGGTEPGPVDPMPTEPFPTDPVEPTVVTLVDARVVLMFVAAYDSSDGFLVPAYQFSADDSSEPMSIAVTDEFLSTLGPDAGGGVPAREPKAETGVLEE